MQYSRFAIDPRHHRPPAPTPARAPRRGLPPWATALAAAAFSSALALLSGHALVVRVQVTPAAPSGAPACATQAAGR
jgi:hypothetical protein